MIRTLPRGARSLAAAVVALIVASGFLVGDSPALAANSAVNINNLAFTPASITVNVGDTVTWTNNEAGIPHTVTSDSGTTLDSGIMLTGATYAKTFAAAGTFAYHCAVHPAMVGSVTVTAAQAPSATATTPAATATTPAATATTPAATATPPAATATTPAATATTPPATATPAPATPTAAPIGPNVPKASTTAKGATLVDANGLTLYIWDNDITPGKSLCNGGCATTWPPALTNLTTPPSGIAGANGVFTIVTRDDGNKQLAYNGKPLYRFNPDKAPGDAAGDGVGGTWHLANPVVAQAAPAPGAPRTGTDMATSSDPGKLYVFLGIAVVMTVAAGGAVAFRRRP